MSDSATEQLAEMELQKRRRDALKETMQPFFDEQKKQDAEQAEQMRRLSEKLAQRNAAERERQDKARQEREQAAERSGTVSAYVSRIQYPGDHYRIGK